MIAFPAIAHLNIFLSPVWRKFIIISIVGCGVAGLPNLKVRIHKKAVVTFWIRLITYVEGEHFANEFLNYPQWIMGF